MKRILILSKSSKGLWIETLNSWFSNYKDIEFDYLGPYNAHLDYTFFSRVTIVSSQKNCLILYSKTRVDMSIT